MALVGGRCIDPCLKWEELFQTMLVFENYPEEEADERVQAGGNVESLCLFQTLTADIKIMFLSVSIVHGQSRACFLDLSLHVAAKRLDTVACNLGFLCFSG